MKNILLLILLFNSYRSFSQTIVQRDPEIDQMLKEVSADSLRSYINTLVAFGTRNTLSTQTDPNRGIGAARSWVLKRFNEFANQSGGRLTAMIDTATHNPDGYRVDRTILLGNVVARLKGSDPADSRIFIISGHLDNCRSTPTDSVGDAPGANDDGSGTAAVMECARIMSKHLFPATVIFVAVSGEEQGLLGSDFMAANARKAGWNIEAVLNNDIMGGSNGGETNTLDNTRVRVFSEGLPAFETEKNAVKIRNLGLENDGKARQLARYVKEIGERYVDNLQVVLIYRNDRFFRDGDQASYLKQGYTAIRITQMNENYTQQHQNVRKENNIQYGDLVANIDFEYLRKNTCLNLANLASLAKAPTMPDSVKMEMRRQSNITQLNWKLPRVGKVKGYYVLVRETTSAFWQRKIFTTETEMRLPYSKDNYFFAVQAVNETGNESLAVAPLPER